MLTKSGNHVLRVELQKFNGRKAYAKYSTFSVGDRSSKYRLIVSGYSGTAGKIKFLVCFYALVKFPCYTYLHSFSLVITIVYFHVYMYMYIPKTTKVYILLITFIDLVAD